MRQARRAEEEIEEEGAAASTGSPKVFRSSCSGIGVYTLT